MSAVPLRPSRPVAKVISLGGGHLMVDPSGVLYWPEERMVVVADLHLEKGSSYAVRRVFLPPYDTTVTLARLAQVICRLDPRRVVALGDSFHDDAGSGRLRPEDVATLRAMQAGREWLWVSGNHDPSPTGLVGDHAVDLVVAGIRFRHEPTDSTIEPEVSGHLHPAAVVGGSGTSVRRRCFLADATRCVLPAFGSLAGGLNVLDEAFAKLFASTRPLAHVLGTDVVYTVAMRHCLADARSVRRSR